MKTVRKIFLYVGLIIFAITFVVFAKSSIEYAIKAYNRALNDDIFGPRGEWFWILLNISCTKVSFLVSELTLMRSGYVFLTPDTPKGRIIRCIISSVIALLVITLRTLIVFDLIDFEYNVREMILLLLLPIAIISLALGKKTRAKENDFPIQYNNKTADNPSP